MAKEIRIVILILYFYVSFGVSESQMYYKNGFDFPIVEDPNKEMTKNFLYFTNVEGKRTFLKVALHQLFLDENNAFLWMNNQGNPDEKFGEFSYDRKGENKVYEFLFNESLILSPADSLFFQGESIAVPLKKIEKLGITQFGSNSQEFCIRSERMKGPLFSYSFNENTRDILVYEKGKMPKWVNFETAEGIFKTKKIILDKPFFLPDIAVMPPFKSSIDVVKKAYEKQKKNDFQRMDSLKSSFFRGRVENQNEPMDSSHIKCYEALWQKYEEERKSAPEFKNRYALYEDRIGTLENHAVTSPQASSSPTSPKIHINYWWEKRLLIRARTLVAGHLDASTFEGVPSELWGQDLGVEFSDRFYKDLDVFWSSEITGGYTSWKSKAGVDQTSSQIWFGWRQGFKLPIWIREKSLGTPYSFSALSMRLSSLFRWTQTELVLNGVENSNGVAIGYTIGFDLNFGISGAGFGIDYEYLSDRFGEIGIVFHFPIKSWRKNHEE